MSIDAMKQALEDLQKIEIIRTEYFELLFNAKKVLRAAIEAAEKQEPVAWMGEYNINDIRDHYTVVMRHKTDFSSMPDRVRPLYTHPQLAIPDGWLRAVDEAMVCSHLGVADASDSYEVAKKKLNDLICWNAEVNRYFAAAPKPENSHD